MSIRDADKAVLRELESALYMIIDMTDKCLELKKSNWIPHTRLELKSITKDEIVACVGLGGAAVSTLELYTLLIQELVRQKRFEGYLDES